MLKQFIGNLRTNPNRIFLNEVNKIIEKIGNKTKKKPGNYRKCIIFEAGISGSLRKR